MIRPILIAALSILAVVAEAQPPAAEPTTATATAPAAASFEEQVLAGINEARTNPAGYAAKLKEYRGYFEGNVVLMPGSDIGVRTREGVVAVDEAIAFLGRQAPLLPLRSAPELVAAARDLAAAQALSGGMGHAGAPGGDAKSRIKKHKGSGFMAEALSYGAKDPAAVVRQLIVDDGVPTRPNRKLIFDKRYFRAGVACGAHLAARSMCVIDLASFVGVAPTPSQAPNAPVVIEVR